METIRITGTMLKKEDDFPRREWVITNGIGGFAGSSLVGANARGYHALLIAALRPPIERVLMVSKVEEKVLAAGEEFTLASNIYKHGVSPKGYQYQTGFRYSFHPVYTFEVKGRLLEKKIFMVYGENTTVVQYEYVDGPDVVKLKIAPELNYRDYHGNTRVNDWLWEMEQAGMQYRFTAFPGAKPLYITFTGQWTEDRFWHRDLFYPIEVFRGLKNLEDYYIPGYVTVELKPGEKFAMIFSTSDHYQTSENVDRLYEKEVLRIKNLWECAGAKESIKRRLVTAADQFLVRRDSTGKASVIAGYPWFTDWGRDSMIALPGLTLATGRYQEAKEILETFAEYVCNGLIPNRFPDVGEEPEYNTVDASLWFFVAFYEYYRKTGDKDFCLKHYSLLKEMIIYHIQGTFWNIKMEADGLLTQGEEGVQLTWMDAKVGDWVVTPREGKAVEINALWYNAVKIVTFFAGLADEKADQEKYQVLADKILLSFQEKFWFAEGGYLYDLITDDKGDMIIRPNQIFALSLPFPLLDRVKGREVLQVVREHLFTPFGLRSLTTTHEDYHGLYGGSQYHRDAAYHQGTVWGWLIGPYLSAILYVEGDTPQIRAKIEKILEPLLGHLMSDGAIGQVSEIFDGNPPHHNRGCYAQAWSIAEILRILA